MKRFADFMAFSKAGRDLAHWHLNYETVACYEGVTLEWSAGFPARSISTAAKAANHPANAASTPASLSSGQSTSTAPATRCGLESPRSGDLYRVEKMKFAKTRDPETNKSINDKTTVFYNAHITIRDIPEEAYAYIVNGKPALEWVMERQSVTTDKDSGIVNDANLWANETMGNPAYPLELFLRMISVCETATMTPRLVVELDDSSHQKQKTQERDELVDGALKAAGLPILHVRATKGYVPQELFAQIQQVIHIRQGAGGVS